MASFLEDLWASIFTAGPTPTLLLATNVSFAALQTVLFILLLATYSFHFVALSILSGALWYAINWFANELKQAHAQTETQAARQQSQSEKVPEATQSDTKARGTTPAAGSDTETEGLAERKTASASNTEPRSATASATLQVPGSSSEVRKRLSVSGESSGYASTDSEWEKVDEGTEN